MRIGALRIVWEVLVLETMPLRYIVRDIGVGVRLIVCSLAHIKQVPFFVRRLWRYPGGADRWYHCRGCGRLWHVDFSGAHYMREHPRRIKGLCRWCRRSRGVVL